MTSIATQINEAYELGFQYYDVLFKLLANTTGLDYYLNNYKDRSGSFEVSLPITKIVELVDPNASSWLKQQIFKKFNIWFKFGYDNSLEWISINDNHKLIVDDIFNTLSIIQRITIDDIRFTIYSPSCYTVLRNGVEITKDDGLPENLIELTDNDHVLIKMMS